MLWRGRLWTLALVGALQALAVAGVHVDCAGAETAGCHRLDCGAGEACPVPCPGQHGPCELHQAQPTERGQAPTTGDDSAAEASPAPRPGRAVPVPQPLPAALPRPPDLSPDSSRAPPLR